MFYGRLHTRGLIRKVRWMCPKAKRGVVKKCDVFRNQQSNTAQVCWEDHVRPAARLRERFKKPLCSTAQIFWHRYKKCKEKDSSPDRQGYIEAIYYSWHCVIEAFIHANKYLLFLHNGKCYMFTGCGSGLPSEGRTAPKDDISSHATSYSVIKIFYGTCWSLSMLFATVSADYWYRSFRNHIINDLLLKSVPTDELLYTICSGSLLGVLESLIDDTISCSTENFPVYSLQLKRRLIKRKRHLIVSSFVTVLFNKLATDTWSTSLHTHRAWRSLSIIHR